LKNAEVKIKEELKHEQAINQQTSYSSGAALGFILMLVIAGISYRAFKQKQKTSLIIEQQKNMVEEKQKEIVDSIHYAKRIQQSLMPTEKYIDKNLNKLKDKA
jgi:predicted double-glycine peptidase